MYKQQHRPTPKAEVGRSYCESYAFTEELIQMPTAYPLRDISPLIQINTHAQSMRLYSVAHQKRMGISSSEKTTQSIHKWFHPQTNQLITVLLVFPPKNGIRLLELYTNGIEYHQFLNNVRGGSTPCCRPLIAYLQRQTGLSTAAQSNVHFTVDWLSWLCAIAL